MSNIESLYVESPWEDEGKQRSGQADSIVVRVRESK